MSGERWAVRRSRSGLGWVVRTPAGLIYSVHKRWATAIKYADKLARR